VLISISLNICPKDVALPEFLPRLAQAGFQGLDFHFHDVAERIDWHDEKSAERFLEPLARSADLAGLKFVQAHGPMFNMFSDAPKDEKSRALCVPAIRACGRLKIPWMVMHPEVFSGAFDTAHYAALRDRNAAFFRSLLPECEKHGVGIAIENLFDAAGKYDGRKAGRFYASVPVEQCELIDALNHPLIGACWDTGHARIMSLDQRAGITALGKRLKAIHIQENDGHGDDHLLPFHCGVNGVDWTGVMAGLRAANYGGAFSFETHHAFRALPDPLFDHMLRYSTAVARHLIALRP